MLRSAGGKRAGAGPPRDRSNSLGAGDVVRNCRRHIPSLVGEAAVSIPGGPGRGAVLCNHAHHGETGAAGVDSGEAAGIEAARAVKDSEDFDAGGTVGDCIDESVIAHN